jgi:integrase/recombinase XerD
MPALGLKRAADEFDSYLRVERGASRATVAAYRRDLARYMTVLADLGVSDVDEVRPRHVEAALARVADSGASAATIARALAAIRHFHKLCLRDGLAQTNPASRVQAPSRGLSLPKALTEDEVAAMIESAADPSPRGLRDRAMLELLYAAGLRVSELVGLDVDDLDLDSRVVRCLGKGERERLVPIGVPAETSLRRYLRDGRPAMAKRSRSSPALFLSSRGARLSRQSCWKLVKRSADKASVDRRAFPHVLRHSFATHMLARGADLRVVQEALGHARLSTTQVYTLVERSKLKHVLEASHPRGRRAGAPPR